MTEGVTEKAKGSQLMDSGLSTKVYKLGNPFVGKLKCDGEVMKVTKFFDAKLPRKASRANHIGTRTQNRHRWSRRVS